MLNSPSLNPFAVRTAWHVMQPLQLWAMNLACDPLIGEHDFAMFCRRPKLELGDHERSLRRNVFRAGWKEVPGDVPGLLRFEIEANAFCHQMVRSIVGTLVEVGMGKLHAGKCVAFCTARTASSRAESLPRTVWCCGKSVTR